MSDFTLRHPESLGPVDFAAMEVLTSYVPDEHYISQEEHDSLFYFHFHDAFDPIGRRLQQDGFARGDGDTELLIPTYTFSKMWVQPGESAGANTSEDWHVDPVYEGYLRVVMGLGLGTEVVTGNIDVSKISRAMGERAMFGSLENDDLDIIGDYLEEHTDEKLLEMGLQIATLRLGHAYLLEDDTFHRAPDNTTTEPINRIFSEMVFKNPTQAAA
jgi:hypothetical protein